MSKIKKFENFQYDNKMGVAVIDKSDNSVLAFIVEPTNIEEKLHEIVNLISDDVELEIPENINPFNGEISIKGVDSHRDKEIEILLVPTPMY